MSTTCVTPLVPNTFDVTTITFEDLFDNQPQTKKYSLWISGLVAILVHGFLLVYYYDVKVFGWFNPPETQKTYHITLQPNKADAPKPSIDKNVMQDTNVLDNTVDLKPTKKANNKASTPAQLKKPQNKISKNQTPHKNKSKENNEQTIPSIDLLSIKEAIGQSVLQSTIERENNDSQGDYFDPSINRQLNIQAQNQRRTEALKNLAQKRAENEQYEFTSAGDRQLVRVDGACWEAPVKQGMEIETRIWTYAGNCETKEKLNFTRKLDKEYLQSIQSQ